MDNGMNMYKRLALVILLVLIVIGFTGHLFSPAHHAASESPCTFHAGFLSPETLVVSAIEVRVQPCFSQTIICALSVDAKFPHPPTI